MNYRMNTEQIAAFQNHLRLQERSEATLEKYTRTLRDFYVWLPEFKEVDKEIVMNYKAALMERYSPAGANAALAALNGFFMFLGWAEIAGLKH